MKTLISKLVRIQSDLKAKKSQYNDFGKYHYRKAEDILEALKPLLKEEQLFLMLSDSIELVGSRVYVKATATITDGENEKSVTALAREEETKKGMDSSQITGAASSYARKYALNGLFGIDDTSDADGQAPPAQQLTPVTEKPKPTAQDDAKNFENGAKPKKPDTPVLLKPDLPVWGKLLDYMAKKGITELEWPELKKNYIISEADEKLLFEAAGMLPF